MRLTVSTVPSVVASCANQMPLEKPALGRLKSNGGPISFRIAGQSSLQKSAPCAGASQTRIGAKSQFDADRAIHAEL